LGTLPARTLPRSARPAWPQRVTPNRPDGVLGRGAGTGHPAAKRARGCWRGCVTAGKGQRL